MQALKTHFPLRILPTIFSQRKLTHFRGQVWRGLDSQARSYTEKSGSEPREAGLGAQKDPQGQLSETGGRAPLAAQPRASVSPSAICGGPGVADPSSSPSPSRPPRATRLESHGHGAPGVLQRPCPRSPPRGEGGGQGGGRRRERRPSPRSGRSAAAGAPAPLPPPPRPLPAPPPADTPSGRAAAALAPSHRLRAPGRGSQAGLSTQPGPLPPSPRAGGVPAATDAPRTRQLSRIRGQVCCIKSRLSAGDVQATGLPFLRAPHLREVYPHFTEGKLRPREVRDVDFLETGSWRPGAWASSRGTSSVLTPHPGWAPGGAKVGGGGVGCIFIFSPQPQVRSWNDRIGAGRPLPGGE